MKPTLSWRTLMETRFDRRTKIKTPTLVAVVIGLHVIAVGSVVFIQGCETAGRRAPVDPPPAVVLPERDEPAQPPAVHRPPVAQPPVAPPTRREPAAVGTPQTYTVRPGDSLSVIARRHGVDAATLMDLNNITNPDLIQVDQVLLLPPGTQVRSEPAAARPAAARPTPSASDGTYVVQSGDVLSRIAARHGVTQANLMAANNITNPDRIMAGQTLIIPGGAAAPAVPAAPAAREPRSTPTPAPQPAPAPVEVPEVTIPEPAAPARPTAGLEPFVYTVRANDTVSGLARDFGVFEEDILTLNELEPGASLRPGQTLEIPGF